MTATNKSCYEKWVENLYGFTPGGDPAYYCPVCGQGGHVYGVESRIPYPKCPDCGEPLEYPNGLLKW